MQYTLGIIVPIYNKQEYLRRTVDSLLDQTYRPIEIVLVDDGSVDDSAQICDEYASRFSNISVLHQSNQGLINSRMNGVKSITTQWITFVDGDDWVDNTFFSMLMEPINADENVATCIGSYVYDYGYEIKEAFDFKAERGWVQNVLLDMFNRKGYDWSACGKIYRKSILEELPNWWYASPYGEDTELNWKYFSYNNRAFLVPTTGYHYCINRDSMMRNLSDDSLFYFERMNRILEEVGDSKSLLYQAVNETILSMAIYEIDQLTIETNASMRSKLQNEIDKAKRRKLLREYGLETDDDLDRALLKEKEELELFCSRHKYVYIYGAGHFGMQAWDYLHGLRCLVVGFIVSPGHIDGDRINGIKVIEMNKGSIPNGSGVIVAIKNAHEVLPRLIECEIDMNDIYIWHCHE
ncbi:glycosyltransferase [Butyrivibrio sp. FCS006]|uniref:glycosyltransferase n=1 Tax=Butyrivibrio sp. FCS006 TaxID=1280684 RepID=UPI0004236068|nr:glycosyltransferase [Butyrivibrio sp. FCS006]